MGTVFKNGKLYIVDLFNGHEYVDLGLPSGNLWGTKNIGANDPEDYGSYFAWGEVTIKSTYTKDNYIHGVYPNIKKYCSDSDQGTIDNKFILDLEDDVANKSLGGQWSIPTIADYEELKDYCIFEVINTIYNGSTNVCYKVTGPNGNYILFPLGGYKNESGVGIDINKYGDYWTCEKATDSFSDSFSAQFDKENQREFITGSSRWLGLRVRGIIHINKPIPENALYDDNGNILYDDNGNILLLDI